MICCTSDNSERSNSTESCRPSSTPNWSVSLSCTWAISTWIEHHRRPLIELLDNTHHFIEEPRRRADDQAIRRPFGHDDDFAFDLLERAERQIRLGFSLTLCLQPFIECERDSLRQRIIQAIDACPTFAQVALIEPQQNRLDDDEVFAAADRDNTVGPRVDRELHANRPALA